MNSVDLSHVLIAAIIAVTIIACMAIAYQCVRKGLGDD